MEEIKFEEIRFKNVRNHFEFQLPFHENTLTVISGGNGKGKSTIFQALMMGCYGETAEGIKIADMVNKKVNKNLEIIIPFRVIRTEKETKYEIRKYYAHKDHGNATRLIQFIGNKEKDISGKTTTDTHKKIEKIILPKEVFKNTVYFSQQVTDFFTALTDSQQKKIFESIFDLGEYRIYYDQHDKKLKKCQSELAKAESTYDTQTELVKENGRLVQILKAEIETKKKERSEKILYLNDGISNLDVELTDLKDSKRKIDYDEKNHKEFSDELVKAEIKRDSLQSDCDKDIKKAEEDLKRDIEKLKASAQQKFSKKKAELERDEKDSLVETRTSLQEVSNKLISYKNEELDNLKEEREQSLLRLRKNETRALSQYSDSEQTVQLLESDLLRCKTDLQSENKKLDTVQQEDDPDCPYCGQKIAGEAKVKTRTCIEEKMNEFSFKIQQIQDKLDLRVNNYNVSKTKLEVITLQITETKLEFDDRIVNLADEERSKKLELTQQKVLCEKVIEERLEQTKNEISELKSTIEKEYDQSKNEQNKKVQIICLDRQIVLDKEGKVLYNSIQELETKLAELEEIKNHVNEIEHEVSSKSALLESKESELSILKESIVNETQIKKEEDDLKTLSKNLKLLKEKTEEEKELVKILDFWKESFSDRGIKSMLIDGAIPSLNRYVREELEKVAPGKFIVSFSTLSTTKGGDVRDKFSVSVLNTENGADSHKLLSGGEKRLIDVATMRALRILTEQMYQRKINLLLLDEVLDSLDTENSSIFCNVLKKLSKDTAICLISHNKQLSVDVDHSYAL